MTLGNRAFAAVVLTAALAAAHLDAMLPPANPDCDNSLPQTLNVGLPYRESVGVREIRELLREVFGSRYSQVAICPGRPLQVNAAVGSDYQILDWLGRGTVDVAVVSALTKHILLRDGVDLREIPAVPGIGWAAGTTARLRSYDVSGVERASRSHPEDDRERYLSALLATVSESPQPGRKPEAAAERMVFESHLATVGFLVPVNATHVWLEKRLASLAGEAERAAVRGRFWDRLFETACFRLSGAGARSERACPPTESGQPLIEIETVAVEPAVPGDTSPADADSTALAKHEDQLVMRGEVAVAMFRAGEFALAQSSLEGLELLFGTEGTPAARADFPAAFRSHVNTETYFGTRTFAFTLAEGLRLLELHQKTSGRPNLALVLPGGGVKAAYQSRLIDELYGKGYLKNRLVDDAPRGDRTPLDVDEVIGTSGGALLGFFVARLSARGPWNLTEILWQKSSGADGIRVSASDLFPTTDLPRYVSLVLILVLLGIGLAFASLGRNGWFAPPAREVFEDAVTGRPTAQGRIPLLLPLLLLLFATPLAVRWVSGDSLLEHIPEFEGLLFTVLLVGVMFVDQCLVTRPPRPNPRPSFSLAARAALAVGLALIVLPVVGRLRWPLELEQPVGTGVAYGSLAVLALGIVFVGLRRRGGRRLSGREIATGLTALVAGTAAAYGILRLAGNGLLTWLDGTPLLFVGLLLTLATVLAVRFVESRSEVRAWIETQKERVRQNTPLRTGLLVVIPFVACLALLDFTRPGADEFVSGNVGDLLTAPSKAGAPLGGFAVSLGALVTLAGLGMMLGENQRRLRLEGTRKFVNAVLLLVVAQVLVVYLVLLLLAALRPRAMTLFELTPSFWGGLVAATALIVTVVLVWGRLGRTRSGWSHRVHDALCYLASRHPDGHWVSRRFVRLGIVAGGGLLWWNLLVAPGLYGNRKAYTYLREADDRFTLALDGDNPGPNDIPSNRFTTQLIAPANALRADGTRFVLAVPGDQPCPVIRQPQGSGASWYSFHAVAPAPAPHAAGPLNHDCQDLALSDDEELRTLRSFVFASGSPFPIFPAHRVRRSDKADYEALVDGGYSNNTPVEAASTLGAEQVLIVNSSHPLPCGSEGSRWISHLPGPLVENALRLPGFLLERAQQLDRRGRANLFVVSISPTCQEGWPILSDFRATTVKRMQNAAEEDLPRRIAMVESWGPPRFQLSVAIGNWGYNGSDGQSHVATRD